MHEPRIYLHPDQRYVSIGFEDTPDVLLALPDPDEAFRDHGRAVEWVSAVAAALSERRRES